LIEVLRFYFIVLACAKNEANAEQRQKTKKNWNTKSITYTVSKNVRYLTFYNLKKPGNNVLNFGMQYPSYCISPTKSHACIYMALKFFRIAEMTHFHTSLLFVSMSVQWRRPHFD